MEVAVNWSPRRGHLRRLRLTPEPGRGDNQHDKRQHQRHPRRPGAGVENELYSEARTGEQRDDDADEAHDLPP